MNKQGLIGKYEDKLKDIQLKFGANFKTKVYEELIKDLKQLDESQKPVVPQFVDDYIKDAKYYEWDLDDVFDHIAEESEESEIYKWFYMLGNVDVFARAWLDGYEVEKEKRYLVSLKNGQPLVKSQAGTALYFSQNIIAGNYKFTRKELEEAGFGWVFDCEGIELEEVEE